MTDNVLPPALEQLAAPPIFVVGSPRSGTTWVMEVLSTHPEVAGIFESQLFTVPHGFGALFAPYNWAPERTRGGLTNLVDRETVAADVRRLSGEWLARRLSPEHRYLVEKTPGHLWTLDVIDEVFPGARVIHVIRDGRDVAVSVVAAAGSWSPSWNEKIGGSYAMAAGRWRAAMAAARRTGKQLGDRYHEARFEDLRLDPMRSFRSVFEFAGIPIDDDTLAELLKANDFDTVKWKSHDSFRRSAKVGDWQGKFSLLDALMVKRAAGSMLADSGYENGSRWWMRQRPRPRDIITAGQLLAERLRGRARQ